MSDQLFTQPPTGRRVLVPGGTGAVGEGAVRAHLAAGADVVVPTRTAERLHLVVHDYTTFAGAAGLAEQMIASLGGIDDVVAPIGGWWAGKTLAEIDESDWQSAFVGLATAHMAVARAVVPRLSRGGSYTVVVGESASWPVPGSGLVSMEQAAVLMMHQVLAAESGGSHRAFALMLGPVRSRNVEGEPDWVTPDQIGAVGRDLAADLQRAGAVIRLTNPAEVATALGAVQR